MTPERKNSISRLVPITLQTLALALTIVLTVWASSLKYENRITTLEQKIVAMCDNASALKMNQEAMSKQISDLEKSNIRIETILLTNPQ